MANEKKAPKGPVSMSHTPDGLDLLKIERRIEALETKKADLEGKSKLIPGRSEKLAKVSQELSQLRQSHSSVQEHVRANQYQSEVYNREKIRYEDEAARQKMRDEKREAATQGGTNYRETLRAYVARWKKKLKVSSGTGMTDDDDCDPPQ